MFLQLFALFLCALFAYYLYQNNKYNYFKKRGIKYLKPLPFVGTIGEFILAKKNVFTMLKDMYLEHRGERYIGTFDGYQPILFIRDPELIKIITIKDFDHFVDRREMVKEDSKDIFSKTLSGLKGDKWRHMRATLSPAFTGAKIRQMIPMIHKCGKQTIDYLVSECNKKGGLVDVEFADIHTRYTNDVIASIAFGYEINSIEDRHNQFYTIAHQTTDFKFLSFVIMQIVLLFPKLADYFGISFFDRKLTDYFRVLISQTIKYREDNNVYRGDMIDLLIAAKKGALKHEKQDAIDTAGFATVQESDVGTKPVSIRKWTDDELTAQAFLFLIGGFDTVSTALCYITHELCLNVEAQRKLQREIDELTKDVNELNYDDLINMKYLDMVVNESIRLWPPVAFIDRLCVKSYVLPPTRPGAEVYKIEKGQGVFLAVGGIHMDPNYWPEPNKFIPERFSDENKHKIKPFTFWPFGLGPRSCIASRFALMDVKVILVHLMKRFDLTPCYKTQNPIILKPRQLSMKIPEGYWVQLTERKNI